MYHYNEHLSNNYYCILQTVEYINNVVKFCNMDVKVFHTCICKTRYSTIKYDLNIYLVR